MSNHRSGRIISISTVRGLERSRWTNIYPLPDAQKSSRFC